MCSSLHSLQAVGLSNSFFKSSGTGQVPEFTVSKSCSAHLSLCELTMWLCDRIMKRDAVEERRNEVLVDECLVGLMSIVSDLLQKLGEVMKSVVGRVGLVKHVFVSCLFEIPTETDHSKLAPPKCKSSKSRDSAFRLLTSLCVDCDDNFNVVVKLLNDKGKEEGGPGEIATLSGSNSVGLDSLFHHNPQNQDKSSSGYVGLRNLGATCYMNSLIQQFFAVKPLRYGLLSCDAGEIKEEDKGENLLYQLQLMLSNLQESEKRSFDAQGICDSYKDWDGNSTNPTEQQDVDEFYAGLMDKVENLLKVS